jgi:hypothetical protein
MEEEEEYERGEVGWKREEKDERGREAKEKRRRRGEK